MRFLIPSLPQVVLHLQPQPKVRTLTECRAEAHGEIKVDIASLPHDFVEPARGNLQVFGQLGAGHCVMRKNVFSQHFAGMWWRGLPPEQIFRGHLSRSNIRVEHRTLSTFVVLRTV